MLAGGVVLSAFAALQLGLHAQARAAKKGLDPAGWGSDHVGKELPEYMTGGECLFCHGKDVRLGWQRNPHQTTIRPADPDSAASKALRSAVKEGKGPDYVLGREKMQRYLRKAQGYGKLEVHSHWWNPAEQKLARGPAAGWDTTIFAKNCVGCHTTAVDADLQAFSSLAIDCFACHGDADRTHTGDPSLVLLSPRRKDPARVVISTCAQCHLRTGKSRATGRPYPNQFVPGDNLFRDFAVSFEDKEIAALNPGDRHILESVREVVVRGKNEVTCLTCHDVHKASSSKHERLPKTSAGCLTCHETKNGKWTTRTYEVHSKVCGY